MDTSRLTSMFKSKFFRHGAPFLILVVGSSFGLKEFTSARYTFAKTTTLSRKAEDSLKINQKQESLEDFYERTKDKDINSWQNIRGPRPWENSKEMQAEQRKAMAVKNSLMEGLLQKAEQEKK